MTRTDTGEDAPSPALVDLLGVLAYGELSAFLRLAADAEMATQLADRAEHAALAVADFGRYRRLVGHLDSMGVDPQRAMGPFVVAIDAFHDRTAPSDWLEGLVKAYVGDGIARDFYREVAALVADETTRRVIGEALDGARTDDFAVDRVRAAIAAEPAVAARLALWARRLVGEALSQAQRVAADRDALTEIVVGGSGGRGGADLAELAQVFARIMTTHAERMQRLGLGV